jgi:hypothetical protein
MNEPTYGKTKHGAPITDALVAKLAAEAEAGFDVDQMLKRRRGRPSLGASAAAVESVRLDPELRAAVQARAEHESETVSSVIREALRLYLAVNVTPRAGERVGIPPLATRSADPMLRLACAAGRGPRLQLVVGHAVRVPRASSQGGRPATTSHIVFPPHSHRSSDPQIDQSRTRTSVGAATGLTLGA